MEFLEDETRPRFLFHSRASSNATSDTPSGPESLIKTTKLTAFLCFVTSSLLLFSAFYFLSSFHVLNFILFWISLSLFVGPFAPSSLTAGDIRVGHGDLLDDDPEEDAFSSSTEKQEEEQKRQRRSRRSDLVVPPPAKVCVVSVDPKKTEEQQRRRNSGREEEAEVKVVEETEWNEADAEILKKQMAKHPVGTPRRWEAIAEAFGGRHGVDSVIRTAKSLSDRRPAGTGDSFAQFLRQRKPVDKRVEEVIGCEISGAMGTGNPKDGGDFGNSTWTPGEDIALLNALKAFPKDTAMRWEKIEAAVPGKVKASCMKRVAELKRDFRSSKASDA